MKSFQNSRIRFSSILLCTLLLSHAVSKVAAQKLDKSDSIAIGLLISENTYRDAQRGALLAVKEANLQNFLNGKKIKLITRSMEGAWGTGAKQTVDLVFNQNVWAIIGSHDGRNAHLAEQVIAKTQVVYISAWSGDPTLAQAYVPWFFSMVPSNIQQAKSLYTEIYSSAHPKRVVALSDLTYDAENALKFFMQEISEKKEPEPLKLSYDAIDFTADEVVQQIKEAKPEVLVIFGKPKQSLQILRLLKNSSVQTKIYGTLELLGEDPGSEFDPKSFQGAVIPDLSYTVSEKGLKFSKNYEAQYHQNASPTAANTYDSIWLLLKKIKEADFEPETFKTLMRETNEEGITGTIQFDSIGNRKQKLKWIRIH